MARKNRRNLGSYWINPQFQGQLLSLFGFVCVVQSFIFYLGIDHIIATTREQFLAMQPNNHLLGVLEMNEVNMRFVLLVTLIVAIFFTIFFGILVTHRAAGAMYRVSEDFKVMAKNGELKPITLRKNDFFPEVAENFNAVVKSVKSRPDQNS